MEYTYNTRYALVYHVRPVADATLQDSCDFQGGSQDSCDEAAPGFVKMPIHYEGFKRWYNKKYKLYSTTFPTTIIIILKLSTYFSTMLLYI